MNKTTDALETIVSSLDSHQAKSLNMLEGSLQEAVRNRLAPDEKADGEIYDRCFKRVAKALRKNAAATRALFELDAAVGGMLDAQGQVSRAVGALNGIKAAGKSSKEVVAIGRSLCLAGAR